MATKQIGDLPSVESLEGDEQVLLTKNGVASRAASSLFGSDGYDPFVREIDGTYETRGSVEDYPNRFWVGIADATEHPDFVELDLSTGVGDFWISVPAV